MPNKQVMKRPENKVQISSDGRKEEQIQQECISDKQKTTNQRQSTITVYPHFFVFQQDPLKISLD
jgi:hypothetical protein